MKFALSEPGLPLSATDPALVEYLRCYRLPMPPDVRYGSCLFESKANSSKVTLFGQAWVPSHPTGVVFLVHGFHEHAGNYYQLIKDFLGAGLAVSCMDLRGHGLSNGVEGYADSAHCFVEDLEEWIQITHASIGKSLPNFLWGHSLGGLVTLQVLLRNNVKPKFKAAILSSPFLGFPEVEGVKKVLLKITPLLATFLPAMGVADITEDEFILTTNKEYLNERAVDPLIGTKVTPKFIIAMQEAIREIHKNAASFEKRPPILMLLAGQEMVTNLNEARRFAFQGLSSLKHKVIEFPDARHELEKEKHVRARIVRESIAWLNAHR